MACERVEAHFLGTELGGKIIYLEESSATVELAAKALGAEPDCIAKTLSMFAGDTPVLILASGESKIDNRKFKDCFQAKAKMIPWDQVEDVVGHAPGGVCPFGIKEGLKVYLDKSLKKHEVVYPAAGSSNSAIQMTIEQLEKYSGYESWVDVCKEPEVL